MLSNNISDSDDEYVMLIVTEHILLFESISSIDVETCNFKLLLSSKYILRAGHSFIIINAMNLMHNT